MWQTPDAVLLRTFLRATLNLASINLKPTLCQLHAQLSPENNPRAASEPLEPTLYHPIHLYGDSPKPTIPRPLNLPHNACETLNFQKAFIKDCTLNYIENPYMIQGAFLD